MDVSPLDNDLVKLPEVGQVGIQAVETSHHLQNAIGALFDAILVVLSFLFQLIHVGCSVELVNYVFSLSQSHFDDRGADDFLRVRGEERVLIDHHFGDVCCNLQ